MAELGLPGIVVGGVLAVLILLTMRRNFRLLRLLEPRLAFLLLGLMAFGLANVVFFFSAAQVYSDPLHSDPHGNLLRVFSCRPHPDRPPAG